MRYFLLAKKLHKGETHTFAFGDEEKENKESKIFANPYIEQMVKENARRLLEEQKKKREEELEKKKYELSKKDRIFQDSQKVREHNKIFFRHSTKKNKKKVRRDNYAWGVDQRKFMSTPQARKSSGERTIKKKEKPYHKLDDKERRDRLGLGHFAEDALEHQRKKSKNKHESTPTPDHHNSSQEKIHEKRAASKEEEHQVKVFMQEKRNKLEEQERQKKVLLESKKQKIQDNLMKLREDQRYSANKTPLSVKSSKRTSTKNARGRLSAGIRKEPEVDEYVYDNTAAKELSAEEEEDYENLYNEFKRIISGKQIMSNKHKTEEAFKSQDKYPSERISYLTQQDNPQKMMNGNRISVEHDSHDFRDSVNSIETQYRKEIAKNKFLQLSKRYENVLHGAEEKVINELGEKDEQQQHYSNLPRRFLTDPQYQGHSLPSHLPQGKPEQKSKTQTKKPIVPAINLPISHQNQLEPQQSVIHELETSNFSQGHNLQDESINMAEYAVEGSLKKQKHVTKLHSQEDFSQKQIKKQNDGIHNHLPHKTSGNNYQVYSQDDNEEALLRNMEILEAAAIFIQKNYRGYRTRKILREYFQDICEDEEEEHEKYRARHDNQRGAGIVGSYLDFEEGEYIEYPYEDEEGRRIFAGPNGQVFLVDRNGKILEVQELDEEDEAESEAAREDEEQRLLMEKYGHKRTRSSGELQAEKDGLGERKHDFEANSKGLQSKERSSIPIYQHEEHGADHSEEMEDSNIDEKMYQYYKDLNRQLQQEQAQTKIDSIKEERASNKGEDEKKQASKASEPRQQADQKPKQPSNSKGKEPTQNSKGKGLIRKGFAEEDVDSDYDDEYLDGRDSNPMSNFEEQNRKLQEGLFQKLNKGQAEVQIDYEDRLDTNEFISDDGFSVEYQPGRRSMSAGELRNQNSGLLNEIPIKNKYHQGEDKSLEGYEIHLVNPNNSHEKISGLSSPPDNQNVPTAKHESPLGNLSVNPYPQIQPKHEDDIPNPFQGQNITSTISVEQSQSKILIFLETLFLP